MSDGPAAFQPNQQGIILRPIKTQLAGGCYVFCCRFHFSVSKGVESFYYNCIINSDI